MRSVYVLDNPVLGKDEWYTWCMQMLKTYDSYKKIILWMKKIHYPNKIMSNGDMVV